MIGNRDIPLRLGVTPCLASLLAATALLLASSHASAQDVPPLCSGEVFQDGSSAVQGTVSHQLLSSALRRNAQIYGAASALQTKILPGLDDAEFVLYFDTTATYNALQIPYCPAKEGDGSYDLSKPPMMARVDLSTASMGAGATLGPFTFFYAASASMHSASNESELMRIALPHLAVGAFTYIPVGFFKRELVADNISIIWDYSIGIQVRPPFGELAIGYLGSKGVFTNLSERHLRAFVGAAVNDLSEDKLPYLAGGFSALDWMVPEDVLESIGSTALYARRLSMPSAPRSETGIGETGVVGPQTVPYLSTHLEQTNFADLFDLTLATNVRPEVSLNEATVGVHTPYYSTPVGVQGGKKRDPYGARLVLGVVNVPPLWYYGVEGGYKIRAAAEGRVPCLDDEVLCSIGVGVNSPAILAAFPYAYNALQFNFTASML